MNMNKKTFEPPKFEIIFMDSEDIIVTSGGGGGCISDACTLDSICPIYNYITCPTDGK
jgi:hypothetical protein